MPIWIGISAASIDGCASSWLALLGVGYRNRGSRIETLAFFGGIDLLATVVVQRYPVNALLGVDTYGEA